MSETDSIFNGIAGESALESALEGIDLNNDTAAAFKADVSNGSVVGRLRIIARLVAYAMTAQRILFRLFRTDVQALALDGHYGTKRWYIAKALLFQFGSALVFTDKDAFYSPVVPSLRIVTHAAVTELSYKVIVKAAKSNGAGLVPLSSAERLALQDYFDEVRPVVAVEVRSAKADEIRLIAQVVTDAKQGVASIQANVELAINSYLRTLDFNGVVSRTKIKLAMLAVPGVIDVVINTLQIKKGGTNVFTPFANIPRISTTFAGHAKIAASFPLSSSLTYTSSNV